MEPSFLDATEQAALVREGAVTPAELVEQSIRAIEAQDPALGALVDTRFERARAEATGPLPDGPFTGVPMLVKDAVLHSEGDRYQHGMRFLRDRPWRSPADSELMRRYRAAGFILLGRTKVPELTLAPTTEPLAHGSCRNPWDPARITGGSSGGSAAAVAAGMVPVAHGNDVGGSIRIPSSCCGLVGLKPSRYRTSPAPSAGVLAPLNHEHVLCRSVRDTAAVLDATHGPVPGDPHQAPPPARPWAEEVGRDPGPLRVGVVTDHPFGLPVDPECVAAATDAATLLESLGHRVAATGAGPLADVGGLMALGAVIGSAVAFDVDLWARRLGEPVVDLEPATRRLLEVGRATTGADYLAALDELARFSRAVVAGYRDHDLILTPTLPVLPHPLGTIDPAQPVEAMQTEHGTLVSLVVPFDVTGQPATSLPMHVSAGGLPVGVQLVAPYGREDRLIRVAAQLEAAAPWADRHPPGTATATA
jgi:amidase